jgi:hypothetical protein
MKKQVCFLFLIKLAHQQPFIMSWKVEVIDWRLEDRGDDMKTTYDTEDRFVVNGTVTRHKTVS